MDALSLILEGLRVIIERLRDDQSICPGHFLPCEVALEVALV